MIRRRIVFRGGFFFNTEIAYYAAAAVYYNFKTKLRVFFLYRISLLLLLFFEKKVSVRRRKYHRVYKTASIGGEGRRLTPTILCVFYISFRLWRRRLRVPSPPRTTTRRPHRRRRHRPPPPLPTYVVRISIFRRAFTMPPPAAFTDVNGGTFSTSPGLLLSTVVVVVVVPFCFRIFFFVFHFKFICAFRRRLLLRNVETKNILLCSRTPSSGDACDISVYSA